MTRLHQAQTILTVHFAPYQTGAEQQPQSGRVKPGLTMAKANETMGSWFAISTPFLTRLPTGRQQDHGAHDVSVHQASG
jgi:hypothetical protein